MSKAAAFGIGNKGEKEVIALLNKCGIVTEKEPDREKRYDHDLVCQLGKKKFTCEVKFDSMACKTGNLAIEHHNSVKDKPSGIEVTKADLWMHLIRDGENITVWVTNTNSLKAYIKTNEPFKKITNAGDGNANLWLYRTDDMLSIFERLDDVNDKEVVTRVKKVLK